MCFKVRRGCKVLLAAEDIKCHKRMRIRESSAKSAIQDYVYAYDILYKKSEFDTIRFKIAGYLGFNIKGSAYHSFSTPRSGYDRVDCIIPKGSYYMEDNKYEEYVSTAIIITKPQISL
jgi:hypothetical protein